MLLAAAAACSLLTAREISRVQGEQVLEAKDSSSEGGGVIVNRCFYTLPTFTRSISVEVTRGPLVRELWRKAFHEPRGRDAEEGERAAPERVAGVGEEAYWVGDPRTGGLYVLRRQTMLRLAVGGPERKKAKLRKLEQLARNALRRL